MEGGDGPLLSSVLPVRLTFGGGAGFGGDGRGVASTVGIERAGQVDPVRERAGLARGGRRLARGRGEVAVRLPGGGRLNLTC